MGNLINIPCGVYGVRSDERRDENNMAAYSGNPSPLTFWKVNSQAVEGGGGGGGGAKEELG